VSTDVRGVAIGPCTFDQGPTGLGVAGARHGPLPAPLTRRILRGDPPQVLHPLPVEPGAAGAGFVDKYQVLGLRVQWPDALIDVGLSRAHGAEINDLRVMISRDIGDRKRFFMDIHTDGERDRLRPG
jgi:hypothetical protein